VTNREGHPPHILIVDCRAHKQLDVESIARSVRHGAHGDNVVLVGIVKKSMMEREELVVSSFLQAGFNRLLLDSGSRGYWLNELAITIHTDVEASLRLRCAGLLLTALDNCRDVVQVTDSHDRVIYENNSTEKVLGFSQSSDSEKALWDFQDTVNLTESVLPENDTMDSIRGADLVRQKLDHGKAWEGPLLCHRRKAGDSVVLDTRIIPVSFSTKRLPDNLVYVRIPPPDVEPATNSVHRDRRSSKTSTGSNSKDASNPNSGSVSEDEKDDRFSSLKNQIQTKNSQYQTPILTSFFFLLKSRLLVPFFPVIVVFGK
jgi:PAS domain-containing protein